MTCYLFWLKFFRSVTRSRRCCRKFSYFILLLQNSWANFNQTKLTQSILGGFRVCFLSLLLLLWFFVPLENFSLIWKCHLCRWRAANFDLCSTLMTHCATVSVNFVQLKGHALFPMENNSENILKTFKSEWITPAAAPLQRSYGVVAVSQKYQNLKKNRRCRIWYFPDLYSYMLFINKRMKKLYLGFFLIKINTDYFLCF